MQRILLIVKKRPLLCVHGNQVRLALFVTQHRLLRRELCLKHRMSALYEEGLLVPGTHTSCPISELPMQMATQVLSHNSAGVASCITGTPQVHYNDLYPHWLNSKPFYKQKITNQKTKTFYY